MFARSANLQEMCLTSVVKDIDFFIYNEAIPEKHVNFLFHVYSEKIFSMHKTMKSYITEDCMMWFLHPRVKKINLRNLCSKRIIERLKEIGSGITSLNLHKSNITENELNSIIPFMPNVVNLDLSETSCSDRTLTCIGKCCPHLESLNVSCCKQVSDAGMDNLCSSRVLLKTLDILYSSVEAEGLFKILYGIPSVECVKYDDLAGLFYGIMRDTRSKFCKKFNLTKLVCDNYDSVQLIETCPELFPKLKKLHFKFPAHKEALSACTHFNNLEELKIKMSHKYADIRVDVFTPILAISQNLKTLCLSCVEISVLMLVGCFKNLENLFLKKVSFMPFKMKEMKVTKTNLLKLVINDIRIQTNDVNYHGVALLISLSKDVTELHLKYINKLPTEILDVVLKSMKNLTLVNFSATWLDVHSLSPFFAIPSMATVIANTFNDIDILAKEMFPKIKSCTLSWRYTDYDDDEDNDSTMLDGSYNTKYYYHDDSISENDISDQCFSSDSDDNYF